LINLGKNK